MIDVDLRSTVYLASTSGIVMRGSSTLPSPRLRAPLAKTAMAWVRRTKPTLHRPSSHDLAHGGLGKIPGPTLKCRHSWEATRLRDQDINVATKLLKTHHQGLTRRPACTARDRSGLYVRENRDDWDDCTKSEFVFPPGG